MGVLEMITTHKKRFSSFVWPKDGEVLSFQGKEEFEKNQKQLLEKGNLIRHKTVLEQQQVPDPVLQGRLRSR